MTWLQHAPRHIQHTLAQHVTAHLGTLGWTDEDETPFGAPKVEMLNDAIISGESLDKRIKPGVVVCSLGPEYHPEPQELGGPLSLQEVPVFFDVFMDAAANALTLASDIRDILLGRLPGTRRSLDVVDQRTGDVWPDWRLELDDVVRDRPDHRLAMHWQVVKVTASTYFPEEIW